MALKPVQKQETAPKENLPAAPAPEVAPTKAVRVQATSHRQRHPVTGIMFYPGQPVEINDLDAPEHAFVRHQLAAKVFKIV